MPATMVVGTRFTVRIVRATASTVIRRRARITTTAPPMCAGATAVIARTARPTTPFSPITGRAGSAARPTGDGVAVRPSRPATWPRALPTGCRWKPIRAGCIWPNSFGLRLDRGTTTHFAATLDLAPNALRQSDPAFAGLPLGGQRGAGLADHEGGAGGLAAFFHEMLPIDAVVVLGLLVVMRGE